jgi:hypothetical protein
MEFNNIYFLPNNIGMDMQTAYDWWRMQYADGQMRSLCIILAEIFERKTRLCPPKPRSVKNIELDLK